MTAGTTADIGPSIYQPYLLVVPVPYVEDRHGRIWLDQLWHRDLMLHCAYLKNLTVLAPRQRVKEPPDGLVEMQHPDGVIRFVSFAPVGGRLAALAALPLSMARSWSAVRKAAIVHSSIAGWPYPPGLFVNAFAAMQNRPLIIVVESAFWRQQPGTRPARRTSWRANLHESFARWSLARATLGIFTQSQYATSLPTGRRARSAVIPASWIEERDLISPEDLAAIRGQRHSEPRFLVASRLTDEKGIPFLFDVIKELESRQVAITLDIMGSGPLEPQVRMLAERLQHVQLSLIEPVPYGKPFFVRVRQYCAVIVPTTGDEQPRVIFDAFSQGVPVVTTDTAGNRQVVTHDENGLLAPVGDAQGFAAALEEALLSPGTLSELGLAARRFAASHTHQDMHRKRARLIAEMLVET